MLKNVGLVTCYHVLGPATHVFHPKAVSENVLRAHFAGFQDFQGGINATRQKVEEFLIANAPQYRSQAPCSDSIPDKLSDLLRKAYCQSSAKTYSFMALSAILIAIPPAPGV